MQPQLVPPVADRRPITSEHHGRTRVDDYDWLRAKDDPDVTSYLEAENAYTTERTAHLADLRQAIFEEIRARTLETDLSVPSRNRGWWIYSRSFEGKEYGASCRVAVVDEADWTPPRPAQDADPDEPALPGEEVLLDLNELAEGHDFFSLGGSSLSLDDTMLAWSTDTTGDERYTVRFKVLATGELLADEITGVLGGVTWSPDNRSVYYSTVDESWRADKVWRHRLGTPQADDEIVFHEPDGRFSVGVGRTRNDRFMMLATSSKTTAEWHVLDLADPEGGFRLFAARREGLEYGLEAAVIGGEDRFLVLHNHAGPDFELAITPAEPTEVEEWTPLIGHDSAVRLEDVDAFATHLVVHQRSDGLTQLRILPLDDDGVADDYLVEFDDEVYTIGSGGNPSFEQPTVRLGYTTMATPASVYDYDIRTRELTLLRRTPVLGGYDPADYEEHRLWATADDGERVPISIVCRRDARAGGEPLPVLLYGYGAYEIVGRPVLLHRPALDARPRRGVRDRARARRRRAGPAVVRRRQDAAQAAHVLRLHRVRAPPRRHRLDDQRPARRRGRQRRWSVDGRGGQPGARAVRGHPHPGAVRRRADEHARLHAAADRPGVRRVGQPRGRRRGLRLPGVLLAVRQRRRRSTTRRSSPRPHCTTPGCSTSSRRSGSRGCGPPRSAAATSCSRPR